MPRKPPALLPAISSPRWRDGQRSWSEPPKLHVHGRAHDGLDPKGGDLIVPGGMFTYQVVVRSERVYVVQITYLGF